MDDKENQYEVPISQIVQYSEIRRSTEPVVQTSVYTQMNGATSLEYSYAQENRDSEKGTASPYTFAGESVPTEEKPNMINSQGIKEKENQTRVQKICGISQIYKRGPASYITVIASVISTVIGILAISLACYSLNQMNCAIETMKLRKDNITDQSELPKVSKLSTTKPYVSNCMLMNDCHPLGSQCIQTEDSYICVCKPDWTGDGRNCTKITYRNCEELRKVVGFNTGFYEITPSDLIQPFYVHCVMERDRGVTEIGHDSESRTQVKGCELPGCYSRNVTYDVSLEQIVGLMESSTNCSQFIQYECYNSAIMSGGTNIAWWVARNDRVQFWSGGEVIGSYCTCSPNATCTGCHCNVNDSKWRKDSGYVKNKTLLPIMQLRFGDVNDSGEEGYHLLGKMRCYG